MRKIFWKQVSILGTTMGSPSDWAQMMEFVCRRAHYGPSSATSSPREGRGGV